VPRAAAHISSHSLHPTKRATTHAASSSDAFPLHPRTGFITHAVALTRVGISALALPRKLASRCRVCSSVYGALSCMYCALCLSRAGDGADATACGEAKASLRVGGERGSTGVRRGAATSTLAVGAASTAAAAAAAALAAARRGGVGSASTCHERTA